MEIKRLTTRQAATLRKAYCEACAAEDGGLKIDQFYEKYTKLYGLTLDDLRFFTDVYRKRNAAARRKTSSKPRSEPRVPNLTLEHKERKARESKRRKKEREEQERKFLQKQRLRLAQAEERRQRRQQERKQKLEHDQQRKRAKLRLPEGITVGDYYGRNTCCAVCRRDFGQELIPPHGPAPHGCRGAGRIGVTRATLAHNWRAGTGCGAGSGSSVHTVSGGLPTLGKGHR